MNEKPKVSFAPIWHTPIVQCNDYKPSWIIPKEASLLEKTKAYGLFVRFNIYVLKSNIKNKFDDAPISYADILTEDVVDERYKFSLYNMTAMAIIGPDLDLLTQIEKEIVQDLVTKLHT